MPVTVQNPSHRRVNAGTLIFRLQKLYHGLWLRVMRTPQGFVSYFAKSLLTHSIPIWRSIQSWIVCHRDHHSILRHFFQWEWSRYYVDRPACVILWLGDSGELVCQPANENSVVSSWIERGNSLSKLYLIWFALLRSGENLSSFCKR